MMLVEARGVPSAWLSSGAWGGGRASPPSLIPLSPADLRRCSPLVLLMAWPAPCPPGPLCPARGRGQHPVPGSPLSRADLRRCSPSVPLVAAVSTLSPWSPLSRADLSKRGPSSSSVPLMAADSTWSAPQSCGPFKALRWGGALAPALPQWAGQSGGTMKVLHGHWWVLQRPRPTPVSTEAGGGTVRMRMKRRRPERPAWGAPHCTPTAALAGPSSGLAARGWRCGRGAGGVDAGAVLRPGQAARRVYFRRGRPTCTT